MTAEMKKPKIANSAQAQLDDAEKQFKAFDENVKDLTMDRLNATPRQEVEMQTKMSSSDIEKAPGVYLKPFKTISSREKFNEKFRKQFEYAKEYVNFIAENKEIIGEELDLWTKPFPGVPAEEWKVPVNKPLWAPRYVAEQIKRKYYHRLVMQENRSTGQDGMGQYYGSMAADTTVQRLDAHPVSSRKSIFMGTSNFS